LASTGITKALKALSKRWGRTLLYRLTILMGSLTLTGCTSLSALFFYPQSTLISTPQDAGLEYQDVWLTAQDNTKLHAWWLPAQGKQADSNIMLLYLHGNAENISSHSHSIYWLPASGISVLALDYRGFGASEGQARMPEVLQDIEAAILWMKQQHPDKELIILGQSIGSAIAINYIAQAADQHDIKALILDAPLSGFATAARSAMSRSIIGWLMWPFTVLIPSQWDPIKHIQSIDMPVLIMHSLKDTIVPAQQGKKLYAHWHKAHPEQQLCWLDSKGPHIMSFAFPELRQATLSFIKNRQCPKLK